ncbi:Gfo/Idh/MocA family protein [candidate division KSB1 bacterium]
MSEKSGISRRNFIKNTAKGTAGLVLGTGMASYASIMPLIKRSPNNKIGIGIIGVGIRGKQLLSSIGYLHPDARISKTRHVAFQSGVSDEYKLPAIELRGICDVYDGALQYGKEIAENSKMKPTLYKEYRKMLESKDIDAVIIATPDHWHATMGIDAAKAGKDFYVEKCMTHTIQEAKDLVKAVKVNKVVMQLGHQGRQDEINKKAHEFVQKGLLGKITLVEAYTNRNTPRGAWQYDIPEDGSPKTVDWGKFQGKAPWREFDVNRVFRWRLFWDYGTGLSGDLLTHEWDNVSHILGTGIPHSAVASGGVYYFKDGRDVPDVFQVILEYPERDLTVSYHATLANSYNRGQLYMGTDATMNMTGGINIYPDRYSERYREKNKQLELRNALASLAAQAEGRKRLEAVTAATEKWTIDRGLLYTFTEDGKRIDTAMLHMKNFFECILSRQKADCNEDIGYQEAISAHMATQSYLQGRKIVWDPVREKIV